MISQLTKLLFVQANMPIHVQWNVVYSLHRFGQFHFAIEYVAHIPPEKFFLCMNTF